MYPWTFLIYEYYINFKFLNLNFKIGGAQLGGSQYRWKHYVILISFYSSTLFLSRKLREVSQFQIKNWNGGGGNGIADDVTYWTFYFTFILLVHSSSIFFLKSGNWGPSFYFAEKKLEYYGYFHQFFNENCLKLTVFRRKLS